VPTRLTTLTVLSPEFTTYAALLFGRIARPVGLEPTVTVCTLAVLAVLITDTVLLPTPTTTRNSPFGVTSSSSGVVTPDENAVPAVNVDVLMGIIVFSPPRAW
jgi:hypothetical protein